MGWGCHWESGTAWLPLGFYCSLFSGEKGWEAPQGGRSLYSDGFLHHLFLHQLLTKAPSGLQKVETLMIEYPSQHIDVSELNLMNIQN